jgi:hypothetical protein
MFLKDHNSFHTTVTGYQWTQHNVPEDLNLQGILNLFVAFFNGATCPKVILFQLNMAMQAVISDCNSVKKSEIVEFVRKNTSPISWVCESPENLVVF